MELNTNVQTGETAGSPVSNVQHMKQLLLELDQGLTWQEKYVADDETFTIHTQSLHALVDELLRLIKRQLIRQNPRLTSVSIGSIEIDLLGKRVWIDGRERKFTVREYNLLVFFAKNPNRVFSKRELFIKVWRMQPEGDMTTVTVHINKLRTKIGAQAFTSGYIETIWGRGYRMTLMEVDMKTILVVDDDKMNLNNALKILSPAYKVVPVPAGKVAFAYLQKGRPDLILLDVLMPDMNGFEVMEQLKQNPEYADIPVVFLTADDREETKSKGLALGVRGFMRKPLVAQELLAGVAEIIG